MTMKPLSFILLCATLLTSQALHAVEAVTKHGADDTLTEPLATGANALTVSSSGTIVFQSGFTLTGAAYLRSAAGLVIGTDIQAYDADLTTYAGITPSADVQSLLGAANYAAMRTQLGLVINTNVQAYDGDLITWGSMSPSSNVQTFINAGTFSGMRSALGVAIGVNVQPYDANTTILGSSIDLSSEVNGTLPVANGGTGLTTLGTGVAAALANDVNASGGLLTYGIIGTSGAKVPLVNVANTWSSVQTFAVGAAYGDNIARFESPLTGTGMTVRTVSTSDFGGAYVGAPIIAFDFDNFFVKGDLYLPKAAAAINLGQMTISSDSKAVYQVGGGTALGGTHIRLGNDGTYQGNLQIHSGDNTVVTTITTSGDIEAAGDVSMQGALTVGNGTSHKKIKSGTLTLSGGAGTVYDTAVIGAGSFDAQSRIIITRMYDAGTIGCSFSVTRADGTSFTIFSKDSTGTTESGDNSTVSWLLINP